MFRRSDWVTVTDLKVLPVLGTTIVNTEMKREFIPSSPDELMKEGDRLVGIINNINHSKGTAEVHLVDKLNGFTLGEIVCPIVELQFIKHRESVPPNRLATYEQTWVPRGVREGYV